MASHLVRTEAPRNECPPQARLQGGMNLRYDRKTLQIMRVVTLAAASREYSASKRQNCAPHFPPLFTATSPSTLRCAYFDALARPLVSTTHAQLTNTARNGTAGSENR